MKIAPSERGAVIAVRVIPRAVRTGIAGLREGALIVRTAAAPVDDAANEALLAYLAKALQVPRRAISIVSGTRTRHKRVAVDGLSPEALASKLAPFID